MTKKDFELIARCVKTEHDKSSRAGWSHESESKAWRLATESIALNLADALASGNPRFDRERFLKACGVN